MADSQADDEKPLTALVASLVGDGQRVSYRAFRARAIDPVTRHQPSTSVVWKIVHGEPIQADPRVFRAIAAGLGRRPQEIQALAARQYVGYDVSDTFDASDADTTEGVVHEPGMTAEDMPRNQSISDRWAQG